MLPVRVRGQAALSGQLALARRLAPEANLRVLVTQPGVEDWSIAPAPVAGLCQITEEMKSICHLDRARCALSGTLGIGTTAIAADDLDSWVSPKPLGQRFWVPVRQKINRSVALEIYQYRSVAVAPPPRPVIHSKHFYVAMRLRAGRLL